MELIVETYNKEFIKNKISKLKTEYLTHAFNSKAIHIAPSLSVFELLTCLYFYKLNTDDSFILSKGHACLALYHLLCEKGLFNKDFLYSYNKNNSNLRNLSDIKTPGIYATCGSLGHGLPVAVGWAIAKKIKNEKGYIYCLVGDGELNEGSMWESLNLIRSKKLNNMVLVIDKNRFQALGLCKDIIYFEENFLLKDKEFHVQEINGHDLDEILISYDNINPNKPNIIIANTKKGGTISFMQDSNIWHYCKIDKESLDKAILEIEKNGY